MGTRSRIISPVDLRRPQGDLRTTDCREPIIGLIIVAVARRRRATASYADFMGAKKCIQAEPGFYVDETAAFESKECEAGTYTGRAGQSACFPHSIHPPTYRWEPDGVVDLLGTTVSPHTTRFAA